MLTIEIPGELRGKGRPRFGKGRAYTDKKTETAEAFVRTCAALAYKGPPMDCAVRLSLTLAVPVPASWSKKKREQALAGAIWPTGKPDLDNVLKLVGDACNGILWADDRQIVSAYVCRRYAEAPHASLSVWSADQPA
ncbi:MAG TPA: RusA family crossover junction endodeoxyribonuclease [Roseococcus sp.]|nr:RusA family crossover junction endodeoxyribonuclease [Roseococcus sp.]